jgi:hypothetical protein
MKKLFLAAMLLMCGAAFGQVTTSLDKVTATGAGASVQPPAASRNYTWNTSFLTAGPTSLTVNLEGSLDGVYWYTLDTSTSNSYTSATSSGEMRHVVFKPVLFLRCNLAAYTQGSNAGVSCNIWESR